jgi:hypothetical protein
LLYRLTMNNIAGTKSSPIAGMVERITTEVRNHLSPELAKLLDPRGHIRTGEQAACVKEKLRLVYFGIVHAQKIAAAEKRASKVKEGAANSSSSSENEDEQDSREAQGKEAAGIQVDAAKLQAAKDRFHPDELYIFFHYGPAVIGGSNNIAFLKDAHAMQEAAAKNGGSGRAKHRNDRQDDKEEAARAAKAHKAEHTFSQKLVGTPGSYSTPSPVPACERGAGGKTASYYLAAEKAKMDKKWQLHDRLLGRMVLSPMYICWVLPPPSSLCCVCCCAKCCSLTCVCGRLQPKN